MEKLGHILYIFISWACLTIYFCLGSDSINHESSTFFKRETCFLQDRVTGGCVERQNGTRNLLDCATLCQQNCTGVYVPDSGSTTCYHIKPCSSSSPSCDTDDISFSFYSLENPCQHDSVWNKDNDTCKCVDGWVGEYCERLPKNCSELRVYGYPDIEFGVDIDLDTYPTPVHVRCSLFGTLDLTLLMSNLGDFSNNKTWDDYYNGYYYDENNFWLGLDKMKAFNDAGLTLLYLNTVFTDQNVDFNICQRYFKDFKLNNSSSAFSFTFSETSITGKGPWYSSLSYGDCLGPLQGAKFSTWDMDNDEDPTRNCAAEAGVGWWFKDCNMTCNPLGWNYYRKPGPEKMHHVKMDGIDFASQTYARWSEIVMFFLSK